MISWQNDSLVLTTTSFHTHSHDILTEWLFSLNHYFISYLWSWYPDRILPLLLSWGILRPPAWILTFYAFSWGVMSKWAFLRVGLTSFWVDPWEEVCTNSSIKSFSRERVKVMFTAQCLCVIHTRTVSLVHLLNYLNFRVCSQGSIYPLLAPSVCCPQMVWGCACVHSTE